MNTEMVRRLVSAAFSGAAFSGRYWRREAACRYADPELFWPEYENKDVDVRPAMQMCAGCLVQQDCLAEALAQQPDPGGIWGGTLPGQRRLLRRRAGMAKRCAHCGGPRPAGLSRYARYCGDPCRRAAEQEHREAAGLGVPAR